MQAQHYYFGCAVGHVDLTKHYFMVSESSRNGNAWQNEYLPQQSAIWVSLYTIIHAHAVSTCTLRLPRHMRGSWTCQRPVVRLAVRMSSVTGHFIDPTLNDAIQQCLCICPFHNDILSFILRKRMGEATIHTVTQIHNT